MRALTRVVVGLLIAAFCSASAHAALPKVGAKEIARFLSVEPKRTAEEKTEFEGRLASELRTNPDIKAASVKIAPTMALSAAQTQRLAELWILLVLRNQNRLFSDDLDIPRNEEKRRDETFEREMREAFIALVKATGYAPAAVTAAATALDTYPFDCTAEDFDAIVQGRKDLSWLAADAANCTPFWDAANKLEPMNEAILLRKVSYSAPPRAYHIAILEYVRQATRQLQSDRGDLDAFVAKKLIYTYWDAGLIDEGLQLYQSLDPDRQKIIADASRPAIEAQLGGHTVKFAEQAAPLPYHIGHEFHEQLAGVMLLKGRKADAQRLLRESAAYGADARTRYDCNVASRKDCKSLNYPGFRWVYLDFVLNRPNEDPYDLFEHLGTLFPSAGGANALWIEVLRATTRDAGYRTLVDRIAQIWSSETRQAAYEQKANAELIAPLGAPLRARIAELTIVLDARERSYRGDSPDDAEQAAIPAPKSAHFAELTVPPCSKGAKPRPATLDEKRFPEGYSPVRAEKDGDRVIAISLSQNYDTAGEVAGGGYWVHVSNDGGLTWEAPLYTGLAQLFPYEVVSRSCLPLFAGENLQIEVEIKEIDTASISYPPVALRLRRQEKGLYLAASLAELRRDRDGDGITDIAEETLLLDPSRPDTDGDGVQDGKDPLPNVPYTGKQGPNDGAMAAVLKELQKAGFGALIEQADRGPGDWLGGWGTQALSHDRPLFVKGTKADFGGFASKQMTLVYSDEEVAKIRRTKPDFHATWIGPITFNRAGTRGFLRWSAGWTGGSYRVVKDANGWRVESLGGWIT